MASSDVLDGQLARGGSTSHAPVGVIGPEGTNYLGLTSYLPVRLPVVPVDHSRAQYRFKAVMCDLPSKRHFCYADAPANTYGMGQLRGLTVGKFLSWWADAQILELCHERRVLDLRST